MRLGSIAKITCFTQWGPFSGLVSKTFHFSLITRDYSSSCLFSILSESPCSHTTSPYSFSPLHQSSRKGMGFASFSIYFTFLSIYLLDCVFPLISVYLMCEYGYLIFCWNCCVIFDGFAVIHSALCVQMCSCNTHFHYHDCNLNLMILGVLFKFYDLGLT